MYSRVRSTLRINENAYIFCLQFLATGNICYIMNSDVLICVLHNGVTTKVSQYNSSVILWSVGYVDFTDLSLVEKIGNHYVVKKWGLYNAKPKYGLVYGITFDNVTFDTWRMSLYSRDDRGWNCWESYGTYIGLLSVNNSQIDPPSPCQWLCGR